MKEINTTEVKAKGLKTMIKMSESATKEDALALPYIAPEEKSKLDDLVTLNVDIGRVETNTEERPIRELANNEIWSVRDTFVDKNTELPKAEDDEDSVSESNTKASAHGDDKMHIEQVGPE